MQMIDAFYVLGATPTDSNERLQELLEEKELLSDDTSEAQAAYADLTNLKKRLRHEIEYFCRDDFNDFRQMLGGTEKTPIFDVADILVDLGWWFDDGDDELYEKINDARLVGGYPPVESGEVIFTTIDEIRQECVAAANSYLDGFSESNIVKIFNRIVKAEDFASFFIDELMAHYELLISETLQSKEAEFNACFDEIESICEAFNNDAELSPELSDKVAEFEKALKKWDLYAQPLQKNAQARGGQHETSESLVHDIRNRLVNLCNVSQEKLQSLLENLKINELKNKLNDSVIFIEGLISLTQILGKVFAELEIAADQLKEDESELAKLKEALINLQVQIRAAEQHALQFGKTTTSSKTTPKYSGIQVLLFFLSAFCGLMIFILFNDDAIAAGIAFIILGVACAVGCVTFKHIKKNKKALIAIIVVPIILICAIVIPVAVTTGGKFEGELSVRNFHRAFNFSGYGGEYGASYTISPKYTEYAENPRSSDEIIVTVECEYSGGTSQGKKFIKKVTLQKSSGYRASGNIEVSGYFSFSSCSVNVIAVTGSVYLE